MSDVLNRLAEVIASRRSADPEKSYVARLLAKGEDAILKKIGEEATETVMAAKDGDRAKIVGEMADLWFHCLLALEAYGLKPQDVLDELARREGLSGLDEKAARKDGERSDAEGLNAKFKRGVSAVTHAPNDSANCLFCKIATGKIPSKKVYEDDDVFVFHDINPWAPVHFLIVPKQHIESLLFVQEQHSALLGKMLALAPRLAAQEGLRMESDGGFRIVINNGREGGQEVFHLHVHVMGGPRPWKRG